MSLLKEHLFRCSYACCKNDADYSLRYDDYTITNFCKAHARACWKDIVFDEVSCVSVKLCKGDD